ncbi:HGGxSTG domain-containing protein [Burkholderia ubonensis]|uniref:HGGxSTG domain-containing protein n=1 Tax=Burkholderia ubonensis TaxID=101571 RepID=UPI000A713DFB|nr:HGGxSTG domain-containing protein [Burkholderia ubonensis]
MTNDEKRALLKAYWRERERVSVAREAIERANHRRWMNAPYRLRATLQPIPLPAYPAYPDGLDDMVCGARTRGGTPCRITSIYCNGRCKFHGGLSSGPTSAAGKARAALNGSAPKKSKPHGAVVKS